MRGVGVYGYRVSPFGGGGNWNETRVAAVQHRECTGSHRTAYFKVANFMVCILCQGGAGRGWPSHPHSREQWPPRHPSQGAPAPRPLTQGAATSSAHKFRGRLSPSADHKWQLAPARPQQLRLSPQPRGTSGVKDLPSLQTGKDLSLPARSSLPASSVLGGSDRRAMMGTLGHVGVPTTPGWDLARGALSLRISISTSHVPCGGRSLLTRGKKPLEA